MTTLVNAVADMGVGAIAKLISSGVDLNAKDWEGQSALHAAAEAGNYRVVELLVNSGANINVRDVFNKTPLHVAVSRDRGKTVEMLISLGADLEAVDKNQETPLYEAAYSRSFESAKILIEAGANVDHKNKDGVTPIYSAASRGGCHVALALMDAGADIHAVGGKGRTLLHEAAHYAKNLNLVNTLISKGLNIEAKDGSNWTALHYAVLRGGPEIVSALLAAGANPDCKSTKWYGSPILVACGDNTTKTLIGLAGGSSKPKSQYQNQFLKRLKENPSLARDIDLVKADPSQELLAKALIITGGKIAKYT